MDPEKLLETAKAMIPGITASELAVVGAVWLRIYVDREEPDSVIRWARRLLGLVGSPEEVRELRAAGASLRQVARETGLSKTTVARLVSQIAA